MKSKYIFTCCSAHDVVENVNEDDMKTKFRGNVAISQNNESYGKISENLTAVVLSDDNPWGLCVYATRVKNTIRLTDNNRELIIKEKVYTFHSVHDLYNCLNLGLFDLMYNWSNENLSLREMNSSFDKLMSFYACEVRDANKSDMSSAKKISDAIIYVIRTGRVSRESYVEYIMPDIEDAIIDSMLTVKIDEATTIEDVKGLCDIPDVNPWENYMSIEEIISVINEFIVKNFGSLKDYCISVERHCMESDFETESMKQAYKKKLLGDGYTEVEATDTCDALFGNPAKRMKGAVQVKTMRIPTTFSECKQ